MRDKLFFELLQIAIGNRKELSHIPNVKEWKELFDMAKKQSLVAIAFAGVTKQNTSSDFGASLGMDEMTYLTWLGLTAKIAQRNKEMNIHCAKVSKYFRENGFRSCVLKGQGNLNNYPDYLQCYRTAGDIDLWLEGGAKKVLPFVFEKCKGQEIEIGYHHVDYPAIEDPKVELHYRPAWMVSPVYNHRLQKWFIKMADAQFGNKSDESIGFVAPRPDFNVVYQLSHMYFHLFEEGIGLRQMLDYYMVLRVYHNDLASIGEYTQSMAQWSESIGCKIKSKEELCRTIRRTGMYRFLGAVEYVLQLVFGMPDLYLICPVNRRAGEFLLDEIMRGGNFGRYDERNERINKSSGLKRKAMQTFRSLRFVMEYPVETLSAPYRLYHVIWRKCHLWLFE